MKRFQKWNKGYINRTDDYVYTMGNTLNIGPKATIAKVRVRMSIHYFVEVEHE